MTILSRCFTHRVAIPLLGIEVYYFLPYSQCFQSISLSLNRPVYQNHLWSFKNADAQTPLPPHQTE